MSYLDGDETERSTVRSHVFAFESTKCCFCRSAQSRATNRIGLHVNPSPAAARDQKTGVDILAPLSPDRGSVCDLFLVNIDIPVHVHVVAADIQCDQKLEENGVRRVCGGEIAQKTGSGASRRNKKKKRST